MQKWKKCMWAIIAMVVSFLPALFGVFFTPHGSSNIWYNGLIRSYLTPPGWFFGVAWTILYALLGIALYLIIVNARGIRSKMVAYVLFSIQLVLNAGWTYSFFGANLPSIALFILMCLFILSVWMARVFYGIDKRAALLVIPYLLWMMFAFYLNAFICLMN